MTVEVLTENSAQSQPPCAMVVDDDALTQELLREMLIDLRFSPVQSALDGRQALRLLASQQRPPLLLVCDIFMPEMDGFEFLDGLAALQFAGGVVLITGGDPDLLRIARDIAVSNRLKIVGAFLKPVSLEQMTFAVEALSA